MIRTAHTVTRTLLTRIRVAPVADYTPDFDEPVQSEVIAGLDSGEIDAYAVRVQRQMPGGTWETIPDSCIVTTDDSGHEGHYDTPDALPTAGLRENALQVLAKVDADALTVRAVQVYVELPPSMVVEVDADAWAQEYGTEADMHAIAADVRDCFNPAQVLEAIKSSAPFASGIAWTPPAK